jgi:hypothetical protein
MSPVEPPPAGRLHRIVLPATTPSGVITVGVAKLPDDRIEFDPRLNRTRVFAIEEYELIKVLVRWVWSWPPECSR